MLFFRFLRQAIFHFPQLASSRFTHSPTHKLTMEISSRSLSPLSDIPDIPPSRQKPRRKPAKKVGRAVEKADATTEAIAGDETTTTPNRSRRKRKAAQPQPATSEDEVDELVDDEEFAQVDKSKKKRRKRTNPAALDIAPTEGTADGEPSPKKKRRKKTPEEEKVYDIPPIPSDQLLSTTFRGRLGYACLNTILRKYDPSIFCSRTCRLATVNEHGPELLRTLALQNIRDLLKLVHWNAQHGIRFMRMSSEMFPFASHPVLGYSLEFADEDLKAVGKAAKELGARLTTHPGQFTQLGSPRDVVVKNAVRDLQYHCEMMDRMGLDQDSIMIIHMGGTFKDKIATIDRFKANYSTLPDNVKARLVLENDELCYNVDDLLPTCQELGIPMVFDYHHDWIYPSTRPAKELIPEINELWYKKGIKPKQHCSEPRPGAVSVMERRAHSDRVAKLPDDLPDDMDLMLECKDKEQAVFHLYRLYNLQEVDPRVLRPPADVETLQTKGRKSHKKKKGVEAEEVKGVPISEVTPSACKDDDEGQADIQTQTQDETQTQMSSNGHLSSSLPPPSSMFPLSSSQRAANVKEATTEVIREAEEHATPLKVMIDAIDDVEKGESGLDCGDGDEQVEVEDAKTVERSRRRKLVPRAEGKGKAKGKDWKGQETA